MRRTGEIPPHSLGFARDRVPVERLKAKRLVLQAVPQHIKLSVGDCQHHRSPPAATKPCRDGTLVLTKAGPGEYRRSVTVQ